jgi:hypothetical protein
MLHPALIVRGALAMPGALVQTIRPPKPREPVMEEVEA